jgi:hypothetical protein
VVAAHSHADGHEPVRLKSASFSCYTHTLPWPSENDTSPNLALSIIAMCLYAIAVPTLAQTFYIGVFSLREARRASMKLKLGLI